MMLMGHVVAGVLLGMWFGLARQLGGIASIVLGFALGIPLSDELGRSLDVEGALTRFILFVLCYAAIALGCMLAGRGLRKLFVTAELGGYDRHMGAFLGGAIGLALCAVTTLVLVNVFDRGRAELRERPSGRLVTHAIAGLNEALPEGLGQVLTPYFQPVDKEK